MSKREAIVSISSLRITKLTVPQKKLHALSADQRAFFVYAGHISNELNWLNRQMLVLQRQGNRLKEEMKAEKSAELAVYNEAGGTQILILTRILSGKIVEALKLLEKHALKKSWFRNIRRNFSKAVLLSYGRLTNYVQANRKSDGTIDKKNVLQLLRDQYACHYSDEAVAVAGQKDSLVEPFVFFLEQSVGNSIYVGNEETVLKSFCRSCGIESSKQVIDQWITDTIDVSGWLMGILGESLAIMARDNLGATMSKYSPEEIAVTRCPRLSEVSLPVFMVAD